MSAILTAQEVERRAEAVGLSMASVCRRAGIAVSTFTRWRAGKTAPSIRVYERLIDATRPSDQLPESDPQQPPQAP